MSTKIPCAHVVIGVAAAERRAATDRRFVLEAIDPHQSAAIRLNLQRQHAREQQEEQRNKGDGMSWPR